MQNPGPLIIQRKKTAHNMDFRQINLNDKGTPNSDNIYNKENLTDKNKNSSVTLWYSGLNLFSLARGPWFEPSVGQYILINRA